MKVMSFKMNVEVNKSGLGGTVTMISEQPYSDKVILDLNRDFIEDRWSIPINNFLDRPDLEDRYDLGVHHHKLSLVREFAYIFCCTVVNKKEMIDGKLIPYHYLEIPEYGADEMMAYAQLHPFSG